MTEAGATSRLVKAIGRAAGPVLALLAYFTLPEHYPDAEGALVALGHAGRATLAMMVWMAVWWLTEAVPIQATALVPIVAFPLLGIATIGQAAAPYASDVVFLFLGGFILAAAIQRWGLDRRIAFATLALVGTRPDRIVAGVMLATAFVSMWVSNTATAAMMVPIALSIIDLGAKPRHEGGPPAVRPQFALALLLAIAYAASIGGLGTIIGSPPNGIVVRFAAQTYGREISFLDWMTIGVPLVLVLLPLAWLLLTRIRYRLGTEEIAGGRELVRGERARLGALGTGERVTLVVFALTAAAWVFRPFIAGIAIGETRPFAGLTDTGIAMTAALVLFLVPVDRRAGAFAMDWRTAERLPWGVLILFGGGLTLAAAVEANGVAEFISSGTRGLAGWPSLAVLLVVIAITVFLSELTSNTAQVAVMAPLLAAIAPVLGIDPVLLIVPCALAASTAFMMPVGTPPNAIVFASGHLTIPEMARTGVRLNLVAIVVIWVAALTLVPLMLH